MHKPVLIGMNNPLWQGKDEYALFPAPEGCTGHRLWEMLNERTGAFRKDYLDTFDRRNLVRGVEYDKIQAQHEASRLMAEFYGSKRTIVLLGEDVRRAFGIKKNLLHPVDRDGCTWRQVPHPSGRNLWYNNPENRNLVALLLEELFNDYVARTRGESALH